MVVGTIVLLLPVRWILVGMDRLDWDQRSQNVTLILVILAYVVLSWFITRALHRRAFATSRQAVRFGIPVVATVLAVTTFWLWSNPGGLFASLAGGSTSRLSMGSGAVWEFGRYPDSEMLRRFKREGYAAVITLEHPSDLVESKGIEEERLLARQIGIRLIEAPMLPWVSNNKASLDLIRSIAQKGTGRYYVHCGLGRDRVNLVKNMLEGMGARTITTKGYAVGNFFHTRIPNFERGQLGTFGDDKWLVPYLNKHEMLANIIQGKRAHLILALDTTDVKQREWIHEARSTFTDYGVHFEEIPITSRDPIKIKLVVAKMLALKGPLAVIVPLTPLEGGKPRPGSETSDQIVREFMARTHRPVVWTTQGEYVPGQPTERGNTEMPPPLG
jgi:hypothetical protein